MSVSVAMATYMGAAFISEQLRSIVEQTVLPSEIVVSDDRSSDDTVRLVAEFARTSVVPVRIVVNEDRLGWRENFMQAASLCGSELIAFCDQDDIWDPRKLELVVTGFERAETLMVFHDATIVGSDLEPLGPLLQGGGEPGRAAALERSPWSDVYGLTVAFRRELLELWPYWPWSTDKSVGPERAAHDQWLLFLGSALGTTVHLREPLVLYRQHGRNAVSAKDALGRTSHFRAFLQYRDVVTLRLVVLDGRIRILETIARDHDRFGAAAATASKTYGSYRDRVALQVTIYDSSSPRKRLLAFALLLFRRSYSTDVWALGRRKLLDDAAATLLGPNGLARLRRVESHRSNAWTRRATRRMRR